MSATELTTLLQAQGVLRTPRLIRAFTAIDRADFVPAARRDEAYRNVALPIGYGQTISQPWTVAFMLELLAPQFGEVVLDVGAGSGWQTALLAYLVSEPIDGAGGEITAGRVVALEVIPELAERARANVRRYNYVERGIVEVRAANAATELPQSVLFNGIIAAAAIDDRGIGDDEMSRVIPAAWKEHLVVGGCIVVPVGGSIVRLVKTAPRTFTTEIFPGFAFVPFVKD